MNILTKSSRYEEIKSIIEKIEQLLVELEKLLRNPNLKEIIQSLQGEINRLINDVEQEITVFYSRINYSDSGYKLQRIIDGDTIVVDPPQKYIEDMKDIRVRLYGIDAPEQRFKKGKLNKEFLTNLFRELDYSKIIIIWDREKENTNYEGYPRISFEREVGNVFIEINNKFLYLNALLLMYPDISSTKGDKDYIRGRKYIQDIVEPFNHYIKCSCNSDLSLDLKDILKRLYADYDLINWIPLCLIYFNKNIITESRTSSKIIFKEIIKSLKEYRCPFYYLSDVLEWRDILDNIERNVINPFDLILLAAENWRNLLLEKGF